jgi:hypothetical protein
MAQFKNNQITNDTIAEHMLRVNMCVTGMAAHPEVAFRGDLVDKMTEHRDEFEALENQHASEWGEEQAATAYTNHCEDELSSMLSSARYMIEAMIEEEEIAPLKAHELRRDFGVEGSKPRDRAGMIALGKKMAETNARYVSLGSPYALPEDFFLELGAKSLALQTAISEHVREKGERLTIGEAKVDVRARGNRLLSNTFKWLVALYGEDANILLEFGFVPKSQIWTPGSGEPEPQPEEFPAWPGPTGKFTLKYWGEGVVEIVYGGVQESTIGWLHRSVPGAEDWIEVNKHLPMNAEDILPFREMHVPIGMWEYRFIPMRGVEKGVASFALIEVV